VKIDEQIWLLKINFGSIIEKYADLKAQNKKCNIIDYFNRTPCRYTFIPLYKENTLIKKLIHCLFNFQKYLYCLFYYLYFYVGIPAQVQLEKTFTV